MLALAVCSFLLATSLAADGAADPPEVRISGFVNASLFAQDRLYEPGNGAAAQFLASEQAGRQVFWHGGDVRNTRLIVEAATKLGPWGISGFLETDFFGGFATGPFAREQPLPRMRLAYVEMERGRTLVRLGQDWAPIYGFVPESELHIAFPLGYGSAGLIGWRYPGLFLTHRLSAAGAPLELSVQFAAMRGAWDDEDDPERPTAGQVATIPQLQARFNLGEGGDGPLPWNAFVAAHFDRKDLRGHTAAEADWLNSWAVTAGFRVEPDPVVLVSTLYGGRGMGHHSGHISQFGDLRGVGAFVQAGLHLSDVWSLWLFGGVDSVDEDGLGPGDRVQNTSADAMARFGTGPLALALNWTLTRTTWLRDPEAGAREALTGHQLGLSGTWSF